MSTARPQFSIDDAFELSLEDAGPVPESSGVSRFGPLHFERRARFEVADEDKQSRLRYQVTGPALLIPRPAPSGTPGRTLANPKSGENLSGGPSRNGRPPPNVATDRWPCPDPVSSDFGPQPPSSGSSHSIFLPRARGPYSQNGFLPTPRPPLNWQSLFSQRTSTNSRILFLEMCVIPVPQTWKP